MSNKFVRRNMGTVDRLIRTITGLAMIYFGFIDQSVIGNSTIAVIVGIFGIISIAFAYIAFCPIYTLGNVSTATKTDAEG
jgi:hypothetical protein